MSRIQALLDELQQKRDELAVRIHLGSMEAKSEWKSLEAQWDRLSNDATRDLHAEKEKLEGQLSELADDLRSRYERLKASLKD